MGHIGLTPQSLHLLGGYKIQGKTAQAAEVLLEDALLLQQAGAFAVVLEGMPEDVARKITQELRIPTIGIGAGAHCDGQILVTDDLLGLGFSVKPRFVRKYADLKAVMRAICGSSRCCIGLTGKTSQLGDYATKSVAVARQLC